MGFNVFCALFQNQYCHISGDDDINYMAKTIYLIIILQTTQGHADHADLGTSGYMLYCHIVIAHDIDIAIING